MGQKTGIVLERGGLIKNGGVNCPLWREMLFETGSRTVSAAVCGWIFNETLGSDVFHMKFSQCPRPVSDAHMTVVNMWITFRGNACKKIAAVQKSACRKQGAAK